MGKGRAREGREAGDGVEVVLSTGSVLAFIALARPFMPLAEFGQRHVLHVRRPPVEDHGQVGHGVLYALGNCSLCAFGTKKEATSVDRKSTRLNSSHLVISYAVFCL